MPRTEEQYEEIRESKRELIMSTALELFANEGYYTTSISRIAGKAGISKGLMYNYFASKEELVKAIVHKGIERIISFLDPNKDGKLTDEEFHFFIREVFQALKENTDYWKLYYALTLQPAVYKMITEAYADLIPAMMGIMTGFFKRKKVKNPELEALLFGALMDGISFNFIMNPKAYPLEDVVRLISEKFTQIPEK